MRILTMKTNAVVFCFILHTFWIPWSFFEGCIHPDRKEVMNREMPLGGSLPSVWQPPFICDVLMCGVVLMSFFLLPLLCSSSPTRWDMTLVDQIVYWTNVKKAEHQRSSSVWEEYTALSFSWLALLLPIWIKGLVRAQTKCVVSLAFMKSQNRLCWLMQEFIGEKQNSHIWANFISSIPVWHSIHHQGTNQIQ